MMLKKFMNTKSRMKMKSKSKSNNWKRFGMLGMMSVLLTSVMLSGCGNTDGGSDSSAKKGNGKDKTIQEDEGVVVSNVEELLDAIEPGAVITIKKGSYDMTPDLDKLYGEDGKKWNKKHEYVKLTNDYDGVYITVEDVDGLTIKGQDGKHIELMVEPRYIDVFTFNNCTDITLSNMTLGHTIEEGYCTGSVIEFEECEDVTLEEQDLYGCGTYGFEAIAVDGMTVKDTIIRDCSYGIVSMYGCSDATFTGCEMYGNKGYTMLAIDKSNVTFKKCAFYDNSCENGFFNCYQEDADLTFRACTFGPEESYSINFDSDIKFKISLDGKCEFDNSFEGYGSNGGYDDTDIDGPNGAPDTEFPQEYYAINDILNQIEDKGAVKVPAGYYNLTDFLDYVDVNEWNKTHEHVFIEDVFDGYQIIVSDMNDISIHGDVSLRDEVEIVTDPRYASIFTFRNCENIDVANMTLGHTDTGYCIGDVLDFEYCTNVTLNNMDLYGCGVYGIGASYSGEFDIEDCFIRDCSSGFADIFETTGEFRFSYCAIYGSEGYENFFEVNDKIIFDHCAFGENEKEIMDRDRYSFMEFIDCFEYGEG